MPESAWRAASALTTRSPFSARAAEKIVSEAPAPRATSTARSTAFAAVDEPSVPTRIRLYIEKALFGRAGLGKLWGRRDEALDRPEDDGLLAGRGLRIDLGVDDHD